MKLLLLGASGLVGGEALKLALAQPRIESIVAPTRRPLPHAPKLVNPIAADLMALVPDAAEWRVDAAICALGTTIAKAGSQAAFRRVDYELPLAFARAIHAGGTDIFALVSSKGASAGSRFFYMRTKGELERDIESVGFRSLYVAQPNLIGGERTETRPAERAMLRTMRLLDPLVPRAWRVNPAEKIAAAVLQAVLDSAPGVRIGASVDFV